MGYPGSYEFADAKGNECAVLKAMNAQEPTAMKLSDPEFAMEFVNRYGQGIRRCIAEGVFFCYRRKLKGLIRCNRVLE